MTNHAEVVQEALTSLCAYEELAHAAVFRGKVAIASLAALTRELAETKAAADASQAAFDADLEAGRADLEATIAAQAERIKALEEESARMVKLLIQVREEIIKDDPQEAYHLVYMFAKSIASDPYKPWTELEARAALAPKEAQG